jgi:hypothetical protein
MARRTIEQRRGLSRTVYRPGERRLLAEYLREKRNDPAWRDARRAERRAVRRMGESAARHFDNVALGVLLKSG